MPMRWKKELSFGIPHPNQFAWPQFCDQNYARQCFENHETAERPQTYATASKSM